MSTQGKGTSGASGSLGIRVIKDKEIKSSHKGVKHAKK